MTDRINECPFCGEEVDVEEHTRFSGEKMYYVECRNNECATMPSTEFCHSKEEAIEKWNTRKPMDRIVERLEALEIDYIFEELYPQGEAIKKAIEIVKGGGKDVTTRNDTGMD